MADDVAGREWPSGPEGQSSHEGPEKADQADPDVAAQPPATSRSDSGSAPPPGGEPEQAVWNPPSVAPQGDTAASQAGEWHDTQYFGPSSAPAREPSDARLSARGEEAPPNSANWWEQPIPDAPPTVAVRPMAAPGPAEATAAEEGIDEERSSLWRWLWEAAILVALAFGIAFLVKLFVVQPFYIPSGSMEPTLFPGDRVLVNKFIYRFRNPEPGDVVVFVAPRDIQERDFIKRVVAVEGQTVEIKDGKLYVDGRLRREPYAASNRDHATFGPVTVADDNVFVMGDNRNNSSDSRVFGPFNRDRIVGEAFVIYWPLSRMRSL